MEAAAAQETNEDESLVWKAQALMDKVTSSPDNPNPKVLHALSSLLETQESRYMEETGHSSLNNDHASHNIGRLGNFVQENDEFFELISSKFLSEARYHVSVQAAATRLLFSCSLTWMLQYPYVFEEPVLENVKGWVMDETTRSSGEDNNWKHESGRKKSSDSEMLRTYSTGLLVVCLAGGNQVVEDVLTSGLSAKLMQYLCIRALGETPTSQRDNQYLAESKNASSANHIRGRGDGRNRFRQAPETSHLDAPRIIEEGSLDDQSAGRDQYRIQACGDERWVDGDPPTGLDEGLNIYEDVDGDFEERRHGRDLHDGKIKLGDRNGPARSGRDHFYP